MGQLPWEGLGFGHGMCPGVLSFCLRKHFLSCPAIVAQSGFLDMDWQGLQPVNKHLGRSVVILIVSGCYILFGLILIKFRKLLLVFFTGFYTLLF